MRPTAPTQIFVYGTLRRGESNHGFLAGSVFLRAGRTEPRFTLVSLGEYPAMLMGGETAVHGEVYAVDPRTLAALDALEEHPDLYRRQTIHLQDGTEVWAYLLPKAQASGCPQIPSGDWQDVSR